jgi:hypothetical protein
VIRVTVDDLAANGLFGEAHPQMCWERSVETVTARTDDVAGLAVASDERIEAYILYMKGDVGREPDAEAGSPTRAPAGEIVSLRSFVDDGGARLKHLLSRLSAQGMRASQVSKVHPSEISHELLEALRFHPAGAHGLFAATAHSN